MAAFNIHPLVAFVVGGAGIAMGSIRRKPWNTIAGAILGVGIILFGLEQLGAAMVLITLVAGGAFGAGRPHTRFTEPILE